MEHKVAIEVYGITYHITTKEDIGYVQGIAREMDEAVRLLMQPGYGSASLTEALVLMSLTYLDAYKKSEQAADHLRDQLGEYMEGEAKARQDQTMAEEKCAETEQKLAALRADYEALYDEIK